MWRLLLSTGTVLASAALVTHRALAHVRRRVHGAVARGVGAGVGFALGVYVARRGLALCRPRSASTAPPSPLRDRYKRPSACLLPSRSE